MRSLFVVPLFITVFVYAQGCVKETVSGSFPEQTKMDANSQIKEQQKKILEEKEVMDLMTALQNDPEMQAMLNDPAAMEAARTMNMKVIDNDPRFKNLRNNPHMRELLKLLNQ